jgi:hypothetical protein
LQILSDQKGRSSSRYSVGVGGRLRVERLAVVSGMVNTRASSAAGCGLAAASAAVMPLAITNVAA